MALVNEPLRPSAQGRHAAAVAEAERLRAERDSLQETVDTAQRVMENMWASMETERGAKARAEEARAVAASQARCTEEQV